MSAAHAPHVGLLLVRTGHAVPTLALRRHMALTLLQHASTARSGITATRLTAGWDHRDVVQILAR